MLQAAELLKNGHYERIEQFFHAQRDAAQRSGQLALAVFLAAASQICRTCQHLRYEQVQHQQALEEVNRREQELRKQLEAIVEILAVDSSLGEGAFEKMLAASTATSSLDQEEIMAGTGKPDELFQRIQDYLALASSM